MKPIIPHKYNIAFRVENCNNELLNVLEPWCDRIYSDADWLNYITTEQPNTILDLHKRCHGLTDSDRFDYDDIVVEIDGKRFGEQEFQLIQLLPDIITDSGTVGTFRLGSLQITIVHLQTYEKDLIVCKK